MKIGLDAKRAFLNNTGLGNYSRSVIESLSEYFPQNEYCLYTPKIVENTRTSKILSAKNVSVFTPGFSVLKSLWRTFGITQEVQKNNLEIYHGLSHELPVGIEKTKVKTVVTIHDLIFLRFPAYYPFIDRKIYEWKFRHACKTADKIIAISRQTKRDIVDFFGINPTKIEVLYHGCAVEFEEKCLPEELLRVQQKWNLPENFVLSVGTVEARKNALILVKSLLYLPENVHLVLVGRKTKYAAEINHFIAKNHLKNRVLFLSNVPFIDLIAIYQNAKIFAYPSVFEGFGLPILEALHSRVPVVAATGSCLEEAGGTHSLYVSPTDEKGFANAIQTILNDENLRQTMIEKGKEYAGNFSEKNYAESLMNVYRNLLVSAVQQP